MATCKDCLHVDVCIAYLSESYKRAHLLAPDPEVMRNLKCDDCDFFKDRSRFVELPCSAGDTVYYIANVNGKDTINSAVVDEVAIYKSGTIGYDCGVGEIGFSSKSIGKRVFLTQAEVEQALAKRKSIQ